MSYMKFGMKIMKYIGQTKLPYGIVMHYSNSYGNIESIFIENDLEKGIIDTIENQIVEAN
ncbi:MAG: hypothetical protein OEY17_06325 [Nitrosopumilus sp.]|nr:hypothetical protein [Nitrosopumilus sp.]MDH5658939.1 hypothetical protein [Nitrosopumilus sp.]